MKKLLVVGSINMDIVSNVDRFPLPGETIHSGEALFFPGGKGANQAVAAARAGAGCAMVGAVGTDPFGDKLVRGLEEDGISTNLIIRKEGSSGFAIITVNGEGENTIVLSPGANGLLSAGDAAAAIPDWSGLYAVLLQNEIPWETTCSVIRSASAGGARVFFNPAPARELPDKILSLIDTLILNETEAAAVSGTAVSDIESAQAAAERIIAKGTNTVIVTLGEQGCFCQTSDGRAFHVPAFKVKPVDTTAAGDTFFGAYAAAEADGLGLREALEFAAAAAALAVTKAGAQASIPAKTEIEAFLQKSRL